MHDIYREAGAVIMWLGEPSVMGSPLSTESKVEKKSDPPSPIAMDAKIG
jgi:hypothetical protein